MPISFDSDLSVQSNVSFNSSSFLTSLGNPVLKFQYASGLYNPSDNEIRFFNNSIDTLVLTTNNNVGIGSTTPTQKLDVNGNIKCNNFYGDGTNINNVNYNNLTNKPTNFQSDWNSTIINKPTNFQSDWNSTIINKPSLNIYISSNDLTNVLSTYVKSNILPNILSNYPNSNILQNIISNYPNSNILQNIISSYVNSNNLTNVLFNLDNKTSNNLTNVLSTYLNSNIFPSDLSIEKQYPPKVFNSASSETTTTFLGKTVYFQSLTLDTTGITYGSGIYNIYSSTTYGAFSKELLFNQNINEIGTHFVSNQYNSFGSYSQSNFIVSDYLGDWIIIQLPESISLTKFIFSARDGLINRSPGLWRCYGSTDGINFNLIPDASNDIVSLTSTNYIGTNYEFTKVISSRTPLYNYIGFTINKLAGNDTILNMDEISLFGKTLIKNLYLPFNIINSNVINNVLSNYVNSNAFQNVINNLSISTNNISSNIFGQIISPYTSSNVVINLSNKYLPLSGGSLTGVLNLNRGTTAPPTIGVNGGNGDRLILWPGGGSAYPYSIGINATMLWYSVPGGERHSFFIGGTEYLTIKTTGIGIGVANPSYPIDIYNASVNSAYLRLSSSGGGGNKVGIILNPYSLNNSSSIEAEDDNGGSSHLLFKTGVFNERLRITSGGNVGINSTTPTEKLDVVGNIKTSGIINILRGSAAPPTNGINGGSGDRLILWPGTGSEPPYSLGINGGTMWYSTPSGTKHSFFIGTTSKLNIITNNINTSIPLSINTTDVSSALTINNIVSDRNSFDHSISPLTITHQTATSTTALNDPQPIIHLCRQGTGSQAFGAKATLKICRYENNGTNSRTRLDLTLSHTTYDEINVMSFRSDGNIGIGTTNPTQLLHLNRINVDNYMKIDSGSGGGYYGGILLSEYNINYGHSIRYSGLNDDLSFCSVDNSLNYTTNMTILYNGNIGIGSTTPTQKLDVLGNITTSGTIRCYNGNTNGYIKLNPGSSACPGYIEFVKPDQTRAGYIGWQFTTNYLDLCVENGYLGYRVLYGNLLVDGNVGLGTLTPTEKLDVNGSIRASYFKGDGSLLTNLPSSSQWTTNSTSIYYNSGNVGLGKTNPNYKLDILGYVNIDGSIGIQSSTTYICQFMHNNLTQGMAITYNEILSIGTNQNIDLTLSSKGTTGSLFFKTNEITRLSISGDGNVKASGMTISSSSANCFLRFSEGTWTYPGNIGFYRANGTRIAYIGWETTNSYLDMRVEDGYSGFRMNGNLLVDSVVGIGCTNPQYPLEIATGVNYNFNFSALALSNSGSTPYVYYPSGWVGISLKTTYSIWTSANYLYSSDERIKKNIVDINDDSALQKILSIQPKIYNYIDPSKGTSNVYGFIAQQIREVLPEAVSLQKEIIPNIFDLGTYSSNIISTSNINIDNILNSSNIVKIYDDLGTEYKCNVISVLSSNQFQIDKEINSSNIFVYGKEIDDFHTIDKTYIYTLNVCATQELARKIDVLTSNLNDALNRIAILEGN